MRPLHLVDVPAVQVEAGDGRMVGEFLEGYCRVTKDTVAGKAGSRLVLRDWQWSMLGRLFARREDGRRRHRVGLVGLPRKNGKSALGSGVALFGLLAEGDGAEVYSCAADRQQARIVFEGARRMVELSPELSELTKLYRDVIEVPATGSVYRVLSSEAFTKEGLSPTLVVYDELHAAPNRELWDVMNLGSGARVDPLVLAITTAGVRSDSRGQDSVCYGLFQHGEKVAAGEIDDDAFYFEWWGATPEDDHRDEGTWRKANPGFGDLIDSEDFVSSVRRTPEDEFRTKRCNQFVETRESWLSHGVFEALEADTLVGDGSPIVVGFDGSYAGDSTGLVGCTIPADGEAPHLFVIAAWERSESDPPGWRVPISEVEQSIREACARWDVREVACDPYRWQRSIDALGDEGWPVAEFNTGSPARMVPACATFYDAVVDGELTHDGDPRLVRHVRQARVKRDQKGPRIVKDSGVSKRKIDLAVCAVVAFERAALYVHPEAYREPELVIL